MNSEVVHLKCLLIDDNEDYIAAFRESSPSIPGYDLAWSYYSSFSDALVQLENDYYNLVVTDIYNGHVDGDDTQGCNVLKRIREKKFLPVILTSSGSLPGDITPSCFVRFVDKTNDLSVLESEISAILSTGIPNLKNRLLSEIEKDASGFLWEFLESKWDIIQESSLSNLDNLYSFIKRRTAQSLGRLKVDEAEERQIITCVDFYIYPPISGDVLRMGQVLLKDGTDEYFVVLTPHCLLEKQPNVGVRADHITLAPLLPAEDISRKEKIRSEDVGKWIAHPNKKGSPEGRYFFFPHFLKMNDRFADLLAPISIPGKWPLSGYSRYVCLDTPYAEALQSQFVKLFSVVGLPRLEQESFQQLAFLRDEIVNIKDNGISAKDKLSAEGFVRVTGVPRDISQEQVVTSLMVGSKPIENKAIGWEEVQKRAATSAK